MSGFKGGEYWSTVGVEVEVVGVVGVVGDFSEFLNFGKTTDWAGWGCRLKIGRGSPTRIASTKANENKLKKYKIF